MKVIYAFTVFVFVYSFYGCKCSEKTIDCPAYNSPELDSWFPYGTNTTLVFNNGAGSTDSFNLKSNSTTPYSFSGTSLSCSAAKNVNSDELTIANKRKLSISLIKNQSPDKPSQRAFVQIKSSEFYFEDVTANTFGSAGYGAGEVPVTLQYYASLQLGSRNFTEVNRVTRDTSGNKTAGIYQLYIGKNKGIVAYEEFPSKTLWLLQ
jgi:hypothetical protein